LDSARIYRHFCMMARALEAVGERWSLLIVRDLLLGPRRFTDLARGLDEITPTRLTSRLRQLEAEGIVVREPPPAGGREVWYRLSEAGSELGPAVDALTLWGIQHARRPPLLDEPVHPLPVMLGTKVWLNRYASLTARGLAWVWRFPEQDDYTLRLGKEGWGLARDGERNAAVTVLSTSPAWARFLTSPRQGRRLPTPEIELEASRGEAKRFARAFGADLDGAS
jgi:DNA-binding HxlR family transcriptional regulator